MADEGKALEKGSTVKPHLLAHCVWGRKSDLRADMVKARSLGILAFH